MAAVPATLLSAIVTIAAIVLYIIMSIRVGQMRGKHSIQAPATTGAPEFERAYRVHMNTLEQMPIFLPALWLATIYFRRFGWVPPILGAVWVVGRVLYMTGYMADPSKRSLGFGISAISQLLLLILAIIGIVMVWGTT